MSEEFYLMNDQETAQQNALAGLGKTVWCDKAGTVYETDFHVKGLRLQHAMVKAGAEVVAEFPSRRALVTLGIYIDGRLDVAAAQDIHYDMRIGGFNRTEQAAVAGAYARVAGKPLPPFNALRAAVAAPALEA